jgi:hypothetical protein
VTHRITVHRAMAQKESSSMNFGITMPKKLENKESKVKPAIVNQTNAVVEYQAKLITLFAELIKVMIPLGDAIISDEFTASQREKVRELSGNGVSRLSLLLKRMSSESARGFFKTQDDT